MENNSSPNPFSFRPFKVSEEQLHAFHFTDRKLYRILIHDLERDPFESMNIMAFWMWLEKQVCVKVNLIHTLVEFPYNLINEVADETLICLLSCQHEHFLPNIPIPAAAAAAANNNNSSSYYELAVLPNLAYPNIATKKLSLQDFHDNRALVIHNVNKLVKDVCVRGFNDLLVPLIKKPAAPAPAVTQNNKGKGIAIDETSPYSIKNFEGFSQPNMAYDKIMFGKISTPTAPPVVVGSSHSHVWSHQYQQNPTPTATMYKEGGDNHFLPEDRTIFITFSKGYPVSEVEVKDFFTRRFGHCIQAVYMQTVLPQQQPLYARVVVSSAAMVELVVGGGGRAKYNIYGKHIWARKYVKKDKKNCYLAN